MVDWWACMLWIMSGSFLSPHFGLWRYLGSRISLSHLYICEFQFGPLILSANESFISCGMASLFVLLKTALNKELWYLHPCTVEVVVGVTDCCFWVFLHSSHFGSVINCCYFLWPTCSVSRCWYTSGVSFSGHFKLLHWLCPVLV